MFDPYEVLSVDENMNDKAIRQAYLVALKKYPADLYPTEFENLQVAYAMLKDNTARIRTKLFHSASVTKADLAYVLPQVKSAKPAVDQLFQFLDEMV